MAGTVEIVAALGLGNPVEIQLTERIAI